LIVVGLWLRVRFIHTVHLYPDEFVTLLAVQMIGDKGVPVMPSGLFFEHGLLFSYAGSLAALLGPARVAVRYASLFFGLITLGLTFWIGRRWFSAGVGLIAVTGLAIAPAAIHWSGRARMYALLQLLVLLTLWLAYEGVSRDKALWRWAALVAYLGATLTHFNSVALAPPLLLAVAVIYWLQSSAREPEAPPPWKRAELWLELLAFILILLIAFYVKRAGQPKGLEALEVGNAVVGLGQVIAIYGDLSLNIVGGWQAIAPFYLSLPALIFAPFALWAMLVTLYRLACRSMRQQLGRPSNELSLQNGSSGAPNFIQARLPALCLTIILLTTTLEMILLVSPERRDDKYLFMLLPVLFLLGAYGMDLLVRQLLRLVNRNGDPAFAQNFRSIILPLIVAGLIIMAARPALQALLANTGDDYDTAFAYVQSHWQSGDTILTGTPAAAAFYLGHNDFYSVQRRGGYDYRILTVDDQLVDRWLGSPAIRDEETLHQVLADHNVWLVLERWGLRREYYDLPFQQQLLAQTDHLNEAEAQGIFVLRSKSDPRPLALDPVSPVTATFGDQLRLTGYTLEPAMPAPGQPVRLTLYWQALTSMPHDYTVFVHLRQLGGGNVAQADHRPLGSLYPTSLWPVGETIREASDLFLPEDLSPGNYELWIGLYRLETGERLPVQNDASGENAVKLGKLVVE